MRVLVLLVAVLLTAPASAYCADTSALSPKEIEALRLAGEWSDRPVNPIQTTGGKVVYMFGSTLPTIIGAPMEICDLELEPGELVNEILVGDSARWLVESGSSGGGIAHIFIKPLEAGLKSTLVVTTNKRTYHLKLVSQVSGHMLHTGFLYPEQAVLLKAQQQKELTWATGRIDGKTVDLSGLDFNYKVSGKAPWKPVQVFNDGQQTFIRLPDEASKTEVPVLLAMNGKREQLVNYRVHNNTFVVDGLFEHLALISGVGRDQLKVTVRKGR
ncbi:MAG: P-type conjugative transfer protein TrbG [Candidatus Adiutrix sp.]|nr:P-type conjugative transfer protein TrbG [Candidatus Adiutrix sp.]